MRQKMADWINVIFGMRKFIAWLALFLIGVIFRLKGYIDGGQFVDLSKNSFMCFAAANGVEHMMTVAREYVKGQNQGPSGDDIAVADEPDEVPKK
jgi:hypothetical protein